MRRLLLLALWAMLPLLAGDVTVTSVEPTVLFPRERPLRQVAMVNVVNNTSSAIKGELRAHVVDGEAGPVAEVDLPVGASRLRVLVPDIGAPADIEFRLRKTGSGEQLASSKVPWKPQRKWKVYLVKSAHEDLGYEGYIYDKQREIADFTDLAASIANHRLSPAEVREDNDTSYRYTLETLLFQRNYMEERGVVAWRDLVENSIKKKRLDLMGAPSGVHSHWMDYEELARMTYPARRGMKDRYGLDLKTFMIVDNPSLSWSGAQALADAGFKYVARWGQSWRTGGNFNYQTTKVPALFWWQAPDKEHRVLFGWRLHYGLSLWYGQQNGYGQGVSLAEENVSNYLRKIETGEELGPYPYDAVIHPEYRDHEIPQDAVDAVNTWARRYAYPQLRYAGTTDFFEYIESQYGDSLPVLSGDLNNFSADYATIDPESQEWKRRTSRLLPLTETVGALATMQDPGFLLMPSEVDRTYMRLYDYDEHSWPTLPRATDVQLFNAAWIKKHEAKRALDASTAMWGEVSRAFAKNIATTSGDEIAVFNGLAHQRSGLVTLPRRAKVVVDAASGKTIPVQTVGEVSMFYADDVPALGYKVYHLQDRTTATTQKSTLSAGPDFIANEYYEVGFDTETGGIRSIKEKWSARELVDPSAAHKLNQMVYVHKETRESKDGFSHTPARASRHSSHAGPFAAQFQVSIDDDKTGAAIEQTITLYAGMKRIDIVNRMQHMKALFSENYEDRYKDNIYFAFPFQVADATFRAEYPGGVVRPYEDQLRWGTHDYLYANRWLDVSNKQHGVTIAPWNAATFSLGEIRYNQFSIDYQPKGSHVYGYAWSNRMSGLLTLSPNDANTTIGYSITSHDGDWNSGEVTRFGWETATPLESVPLERNTTARWKASTQGFLSVSAPNVQLTVLKPSEQPGRGYVLRFAETDGKPIAFDVDLSKLGAQRAFLCDLVENDLSEVAVTGGKVRLRIRPHGFLTVRFETTAAKAATAPVVNAKAERDDAIRLNWDGPHKGTWNVYRSVDPQDPAVADTLVARVTTPTYLDEGLHHKTRYYYRVAAVALSNQQGDLSTRVDAETNGPNTAAPAVVQEFGVVRRAVDRLMVYWRTNTEPDLARYYLYRGEQPNFAIEGQEPVAVLAPIRRFLQMYQDSGLEAGKTYYYKVFAEDWAGNLQSVSPVASATTPIP